MAIRSVQTAKDTLSLLGDDEGRQPVSLGAAVPPYCKTCGAPVHRVGTAWFHDSETPQLATIARDVVES